MKFLKKLKSGNFWISLISAGVLIAEGIFDFEIKTEYLNQILLGLMGILTLFGIVSDHGDTSVILNTSTSTDNQEEKTESANNSASDIKSICDTVSLLLNKVSINSNLDIENMNGIINEVKEINEALHKENEKLEHTNQEENIQSNKQDSEELIENKVDENMMCNLVLEETKVEEAVENSELEQIVVEDKGCLTEQVVKVEQEVKNEELKPIENETQEISIVND